VPGGRSSAFRHGVLVLAPLFAAFACHKGVDGRGQPVAAAGSTGAPAGSASLSTTSLEELFAEYPGRCVKRVVVSVEDVCFQFDRGHYLCRGANVHLGQARVPPYYSVIPTPYQRISLDQLACGLRADHKLECWGLNVQNTIDSPLSVVKTPTPLTLVKGPVDDFATFDNDYCALSGGKVTCWPFWRQNSEIQGLGVVRWLGAGATFGCAGNEHELWCWGAQWTEPNPNPTLSHTIPVKIALPPGLEARQLHVGSVGGCVLGSDDAVYCFGNGAYGAWGDGQVEECDSDHRHGCELAITLHNVAALGHDVKALTVGGGFACVLKKDASVWCWGNNGSHVVGEAEHRVGNLTVEPSPLVRAELGHDNVSVQAGSGHVCVEKADGALWCWGNNRSSELAPGGTPFEPPRPIALPAPRCQSP
jgi:hypothetical protein